MWSTIADITDDLVLYRDLQPCDATLPGLAALRAMLRIAPTQMPRKRQREYSQVVLAIIDAALAQRQAGSPRSLLVIGDTENDRQFATQLREASGLPTVGFIGYDSADSPALTWDGDTATGNRWSLLHDVIEQATTRGVVPGPGLVALIDIDKTLLGPRGRNHAATDTARLQGTLAIGRALLGPELDPVALEATYRALCLPAVHPFTLDNQDIVVYAALLITAGVIRLDDIKGARFGDLLEQTASIVPSSLRETHQAVQQTWAAGDPTAFKAFRREEFRVLVELMAAGELLLCTEVMSVAQQLRAAGALCVAASDKPAEASLPSAEQAAAGLLPVHRTPALVG